MKSYELAINKIAMNKTIIDVGAGTGILSMIAAKAGALQIYAIECSNICQQAKTNIKENNLETQIVLFNVKAEEFYYENLRVDVFISEWMGYFMIFENMLPSVLHIRDQYLKEDGIMIPTRGQLFLSTFTNISQYQGINIHLEDQKLIDQALIDIIPYEKIGTSVSEILDIDLKNDKFEKNQFQSSFTLIGTSQCVISGFISWFDMTLFDDIKLSTSPSQAPTHWKQTLFMLQNSFKLNENETVQGKINVQPLNRNYRALSITITYKSETMKSSKTQQWFIE